MTKTLESMQSTLRQARQDKSFQTAVLHDRPPLGTRLSEPHPRRWRPRHVRGQSPLTQGLSRPRRTPTGALTCALTGHAAPQPDLRTAATTSANDLRTGTSTVRTETAIINGHRHRSWRQRRRTDTVARRSGRSDTGHGRKPIGVALASVTDGGTLSTVASTMSRATPTSRCRSTGCD